MTNLEQNTYTTSLEALQVGLERESQAAGAEQYLKEVAELAADGELTRSRPVAQLLASSVNSTAEAITHTRNVRKRGPAQAGLVLTRDMDAQVLAVHALRTCLDSLTTNHKLTTAAHRIGTAVMEEENLRRWCKSDDRRYTITQRHIETATTGDRKRAIVRHMMKLADTPDAVSWDDTQRVHVGTYLIDAVLASTALFTVHLRVENSTTVRVLYPTPEVLEWLQKAHARTAQFLPLRVPMVAPPRPWSGPFGGGYLTDIGGRLPMVKTRNRAYLHSLADVSMQNVYDAVNAIQGVAWRINEAVRSVAAQCWDLGFSVGTSMPNREAEPLPAMPCGPAAIRAYREADRDGYKAWARKAAAVHERNAKLVGKRQSAATKLAVSERFTKHAAIYFPHQVDFRGRVYPIPAGLQPQGDDLARGLLQFAEAKPITERGIWWLKVHIANCYGVDKVALVQRVQWVDARLDALMDSALMPMDGERFWMTAEDPFQALAACIELTGALIEGPSYLSRLSIPMDGSCNGLQNFSAMLRDPVGGKATNLIPQVLPADIYTEVANVVAAQVRKDAEAGHVHAILWDGHVSRKIVKQPVMTLPYGATKSGMRSQIEDALRKNLPGLFPQDETWAACSYLAAVTYDAIGTVVVAARTAMDWLREAARIAASVDFPVRWTAPSGFPVMQDYRERLMSVVKVHINGAQMKLNLAQEGEQLDKRRQSQGISPNLVHSFDAAHLMGTVNLAAINGITSIALIHDSYGTHAADTDLLHACIRDAFIEQYRGDALGDFRNELIEQLPEKIAQKLPPLPPMGDLDLDLVRQSAYFFA